MKIPNPDPHPAKGKVLPKSSNMMVELPNPFIRAAIALRTGAFVVLEPIDFAARLLNGKRHWPSLALRRYAGPLANLEASGAEFVAYLKLLCGANSESQILDIGCGFGLVALALDSYLAPTGKYVGLDINAAAIRWATRHVSSRMPNFSFIHLDIKNDAYNPNGLQSADDLVLPMADASFDIVLLKSVFTHLRPREVTNYLHEIARLLGPRGVCLSTFFLLNEAQASLHSRGLNSLDFRFGADAFRYAFRDLPELAIGFAEEAMRAMAAEAHLAVSEIRYGNWSGRPDGLSYQDVVLFTPIASSD